MESILQNSIKSVQESDISFSKFITANDTGTTGGHQKGYHIHKNAWSLIFDKPGLKGSNDELFVTIRWQNDFETESRFIYYGVSTRNEYRLTRFGKGFPYLSDDNVGDLLVLCKKSSSYYEAYVLQSDDEIEEFFSSLNLSPNDTNKIIPKQFQVPPEDKIFKCFISYFNSLQIDFPSTQELSLNSRNCYNNSFNIKVDSILKDPDKRLLDWLDAEFQLFKIIENNRYSERIKIRFSSVEELIEVANTILNRRKSRAGKSLENHLTEIFNLFKISFETQVITEDNKKPDFIFPSQEAYCNVLTPQIAGHNLINKLGLIKFGNYDKNTTKFYT